MPMMAMTTSNSIRVKPLVFCIFIFCYVLWLFLYFCALRCCFSLFLPNLLSCLPRHFSKIVSAVITLYGFLIQNRLFFTKPEDDTRPLQNIRKNGIRKGDVLLILSLNIKSTVFLRLILINILVGFKRKKETPQFPAGLQRFNTLGRRLTKKLWNHRTIAHNHDRPASRRVVFLVVINP